MIRSKNNNMFVYSSYWQTWSRILFHDHGGKGMQKMREKYQIPNHIKTIEVDLTGINGDNWFKKVAKVNIRCLGDMDYEGKHLHGALSEFVVENMEALMDQSIIDTLLHADLLEYIDFDKYRTWNNGGAIIAHCFKDFMTLDQYWRMQIANGGGPGLLRLDVMNDWEEESKTWEEALKKIIPRE